jgi:hypothetical protein
VQIKSEHGPVDVLAWVDDLIILVCEIQYRRAGNFRKAIFSLYSRIVRIRKTLTVKISTDAQ